LGSSSAAQKVIIVILMNACYIDVGLPQSNFNRSMMFQNESPARSLTHHLENLYISQFSSTRSMHMYFYHQFLNLLSFSNPNYLSGQCFGIKKID